MCFSYTCCAFLFPASHRKGGTSHKGWHKEATYHAGHIYATGNKKRTSQTKVGIQSPRQPRNGLSKDTNSEPASGQCWADK